MRRTATNPHSLKSEMGTNCVACVRHQFALDLNDENEKNDRCTLGDLTC
uniref:Uncharacterized protein n=1 Tax=Arundo donax TaxID=35708 RepID=A0A0A9BVF2_ARUDO